MKINLYFILGISLVGCASKQVVYYPVSPSKNIVNTVRPGEAIDGLRYQEEVKAYPLGRYRDSRNSRIMHERHLAYRLEQDSSWDYSPNRNFAIPLGKVEAVSKPNSASSLKSASAEVEIKKQQDHNTALIEQNKVLTTKLEKAEEESQKITQLAEENQKLQKQLNQVQGETDTLKRNLEEKSKKTVVIEQPKEKGFIEKLKLLTGIAQEEKINQ